MNDRLYRSRDDRVIGGVCAGLADRLDLDPSLVRIGWAVLTVFTGGLLLLLYIVMLIVVPEEPAGGAAAAPRTEPGAVPGWTAPGSGTAWTPPPGTRPGDPAAGWGAAAPGASPASSTEADAGAAGSAAAGAAGAEAAGTGAAGSTGAAATAGAEGWIPPSASAPYPDDRAARRAERRAARAERRRNADPIAGVVFGAILVLLGGYFLLQQYVPSLDLGRFWPVVIIGIGVVLVVRAVSRPREG